MDNTTKTAVQALVILGGAGFIFFEASKVRRIQANFDEIEESLQDMQKRLESLEGRPVPKEQANLVLESRTRASLEQLREVLA